MFCTRSDAVVWCLFRYSVCKDLNGMVRLSGTGWSKFIGKYIFMTRQPGAYTLTVMRHFEKLYVIGAGAPTIWSSALACCWDVKQPTNKHPGLKPTESQHHATNSPTNRTDLSWVAVTCRAGPRVLLLTGVTVLCARPVCQSHLRQALWQLLCKQSTLSTQLLIYGIQNDQFCGWVASGDRVKHFVLIRK